MITHKHSAKKIIVLFLFISSFTFSQSPSQPRLLDDFETFSGWRSVVSEGAKLNVLSGEGKTGKGLVMDFNLQGVYGYVIATKEFDIDLTSNYQFTFDMKADIPVNNFEFKLVDEKEDVFWIKKMNVTYPKNWEKQKIKKRHISFAWGPSGGGEIKNVKRIEFVISSGQGGKGKVFVDNFRFEPIDEAAAEKAVAKFKASSTKKGVKSALNKQGTLLNNWKSGGKKESESITIDFGYQKEIGGLKIDWENDYHARAYTVELSDDGTQWTTVYTVSNGNGGRDYIYLPEKDAKIIRINFQKSSKSKTYGIAQLEVKRSEFAFQRNNFFSAIASEFRKGLYPKYFLNQQTNWTVVGVSGDTKEALINEIGMVEADKESFSIEPFLYLDGKLVTWNDVERTHSLLNNYLPIPSTTWKYGGWEVNVRVFAAGEAGQSASIVTYRIENKGGNSTSNGKLFVAIRPFQVNPPWQWLNTLGGASRIDSIKNENGILQIDTRQVIPVTKPTTFGATSFDNGDISEFIENGKIPTNQTVHDNNGFASAALQYDFNIESGNAKEFHVVIPFHGWQGNPMPNMSDDGQTYVNTALASTVQFWESRLDNVQIKLPSFAQPIINTVKSNLAYIFINCDGAGIQPGSRNYERSWIRDGSLTATGLLQMGVKDEVREYIDWYSKFLFPNGKVPCVVDFRGGDPTNEHDSHGQYIYAVTTYFNFTKDTTWLRGKFESVVNTVRYIQSLRAERKTDKYKNGTPEERALYGLVPESISHEGYWDVPRHSYWDVFFILRGLKDAAKMAVVLGEGKYAEKFSAERDDFRKDFYNSVRLAMQNKNIDYIPGCAELGDFDATSTTVGITPANELGLIPEPQLHNTFDKYYKNFIERRENKINWINYTPYETRVIGSFVYLDQKERAHEAIDFFMNDRRPAGWNHWAEVVWREPSTPKFIGDMPHTWVGSDFIRSIRSLFVYEHEQDTSLVIGAGIPESWVNDPTGVEVTNFPTWYGNVSYSMKKNSNGVMIQLSGNINLPAGKIIVKSPCAKGITSAAVNGVKSTSFNTKEVVLDKLPAKIEIQY